MFYLIWLIKILSAYVCKILYLFESNHGPVGHVVHYCRGGHTVLGEVADPKEIFAILDCEDIQLMEVLKKVNVTYWPGKMSTIFLQN